MTMTEIPKRYYPTNSRLTKALRALNPEDPLSVIYGEILSILKMQNDGQKLQKGILRHVSQQNRRRGSQDDSTVRLTHRQRESSSK